VRGRLLVGLCASLAAALLWVSSADGQGGGPPATRGTSSGGTQGSGRPRNEATCASGKDSVELAVTLVSLGDQSRSAGDLAQAGLCFRRALSIREAALPPNDRLIAEAAAGLGIALGEDGQLEEAARYLEKAISIGGIDKLARVRNELATLRLLLNDADRAAALFQETMNEWQKSMSSMIADPDYVRAINGLASVHTYRGDLAAATRLYEAAAGVVRSGMEGHGGVTVDDPIFAETLMGLAHVLVARGDDSGGLRYATRAVEILESRGPSSARQLASALAGVADAHVAMREYEKARSALERALTVAGGTRGSELTTLRLSLSLAKVARYRDDCEEARRWQKQGLAIIERARPADSPLIANELVNLAEIERCRGEPRIALEHLERAISIYRGRPEDARGLAAALQSHGALAWAMGSLEAAVASFAEAAETEGKTSFMRQSTLRETRMETQQSRWIMDASISLHMTAKEVVPAAAMALSSVLRTKARVLEEALHVHGLFAMRDMEHTWLRNSLVDINRQLSTLLMAGIPKGEEQAVADQVIELLGKAERVERNVLTVVGSQTWADEAVTVESVRSSLPSTSVVVEIALYMPISPNRTGLVNFQTKAPRYVAYSFTRKGPILWRDLGDAEKIDKLVRRFNDSLANHGAEQELRARARALDGAVGGPLRELIGDNRSVLIAPDGALHLVPFGALVDEDGRYLIQRYNFTYYSSARELLRLREDLLAPRRAPVIVADVDFGSLPSAQQPAVDRPAGFFDPLPGTAREARDVAALLPAATVLSGKEASEAAFRKIRSPIILHVATHGFSLDPAQFSPGAAPDDLAVRLAAALPALRTGLALAGANRTAREGEDGLLTALEASTLDLTGTQLVVLSACQTGVGEVQKGEGVQSLRRALQIAGAQTVVASLWQVRDASTAALMRDYYKNLESAGRSEAMRRAQISMAASDQWSHPYYWSGFLVSGDFRTFDGREVDVRPELSLRVPPGPQGCGCELAPARTDGSWGLAMGLVLCAVHLHRRRTVCRSP
jgi:CHAT domain-containing protein